MDKEYSTWNAGIRTFNQLADFKEAYILAYLSKQYSESINILNTELDFIYGLIIQKSNNIEVQEQLDRLRSIIDDVENKADKNIPVQAIKKKIKEIRRELWMIEAKNELLAPFYQKDDSKEFDPTKLFD